MAEAGAAGAAGTGASTSGTIAGTGAPATPGSQGTGVSTGAPITTESINPGAWMAGFNDDLKGYVGTKGFKGPADLVDAYRNFEKLQGVPQDRIMKLPERFYDDANSLTPEGRAIFERLGAPKDLKEYGIEAPKENADPKRLEGFLKTAQELGLTKAQAQKLVAHDTEYFNQTVASMKEASAQKFKDSQASLVKDWGAALDQNTQIAREGAKRMGHDAKTMDALSTVLGHAETMKLYHQLGSAVSESTFIQGRQQATKLEPVTALAQIQALKQDKAFAAKYASGDSEAVAKMTRLHEMAYQGTMTLT